MISYSNKEIEKYKRIPNHAYDTYSFDIVYTHEDGTKEICKCESTEDEDGLKTWELGMFTTKAGEDILAVFGGRIINKQVKKLKKNGKYKK